MMADVNETQNKPIILIDV